tara:strand:- start:293 stop:529 length:237 start_codon:yes stop_codon:yes gene_type:complete
LNNICYNIVNKKSEDNMKKLIILVSTLILVGCNTTYVTPKGQRLLGNTAAGCILGEVAFGACEEGAAVGALSTIISDQ